MGHTDLSLLLKSVDHLGNQNTTHPGLFAERKAVFLLTLNQKALKHLLFEKKIDRKEDKRRIWSNDNEILQVWTQENQCTQTKDMSNGQEHSSEHQKTEREI